MAKFASGDVHAKFKTNKIKHNYIQKTTTTTIMF